MMQKEELLEKQNAILSTALDMIWEHLTTEQQINKEWIWKEMDDKLNNLEIENRGL